MKLFGSFVFLFVVIFGVVMVVTGEWDRRVLPAIRRTVLSEGNGDGDAAAPEAGAADSLAAGGGASATAGGPAPEAVAGGGAAGMAAGGADAASGSGGGGAGGGTVTGGTAAGGTGGPVAAIVSAALDSWRQAQQDSLQVLHEEIMELAGRLGALEARMALASVSQDQGETEAWKTLSRMFASMRSDEASRIIEHLPEKQAVQLLAGMNPRSSAELMGKLQPEEAARLSGRMSIYLRDQQVGSNVQ